MVKVLILFGQPADVPAFEQYFYEVYRPQLSELPQMQSFCVNAVSGSAVGESPFHSIVELQFASEEAMQAGLNSDEGKAVAGELANFATGGATVLFCQAQNNPLDAD